MIDDQSVPRDPRDAFAIPSRSGPRRSTSSIRLATAAGRVQERLLQSRMFLTVPEIGHQCLEQFTRRSIIVAHEHRRWGLRCGSLIGTRTSRVLLGARGKSGRCVHRITGLCCRGRRCIRGTHRLHYDMTTHRRLLELYALQLLHQLRRLGPAMLVDGSTISRP